MPGLSRTFKRLEPCEGKLSRTVLRGAGPSNWVGLPVGQGSIWGESAGALSVSHLMATPLSKGLFHRAIMQNPYMPPSLLMNQGRFGKGSAVSQGAKLGEAAGVTSLAGLRALPAQSCCLYLDLLGYIRKLGWMVMYSRRIFMNSLLEEDSKMCLCLPDSTVGK